MGCACKQRQQFNRWLDGKVSREGEGRICCFCAGAHLISDSDEIHETGNGDEK